MNQITAAVTTVTDFVATGITPEAIGDIPYMLSLLAVVLIPIATQALKSLTNPPKWLNWLLPMILSISSAAVTALAYGYLPWTKEGMPVVLAIIMGGVGGQGIYVANKARVKNATSN